MACIGSPFGNDDSLSVGVVSATKRAPDSLLTSDYSLVDAIQTDAPINHGNSGGPLFNAQGEVIGITAKIRSDTGNAEGVGFAVPINSAKRSMSELIADGKVSYGYVGISTVDLTPTLARHYRIPVKYGAVVANVRDGSPAEKAGLQAGETDTFDDVDFRRAATSSSQSPAARCCSKEDVVRTVTESLHPGDVARLTIVRGGKRIVVPVKLGSRPNNP